MVGQVSPEEERAQRYWTGARAIVLEKSDSCRFLLKRCSITFLFLFHDIPFRPQSGGGSKRTWSKARKRQDDEWYPDQGGKHPECELRESIEQWDQVGIIHVKAGQQDDIRPNHPDDMNNHPVFSQRAQHPRFLTKSSDPITTDREPIPDQSYEEEIGRSLPMLDREQGGREKDQGIGPQIAYSEAWMTSLTLWRT